jgi:hypothetical protein
VATTSEERDLLNAFNSISQNLLSGTTPDLVRNLLGPPQGPMNGPPAMPTPKLSTFGEAQQAGMPANLALIVAAESAREGAEGDARRLVDAEQSTRENRVRKAAEALVRAFPEAILGISPLAPHSNAVQRYADEFGVSAEELNRELKALEVFYRQAGTEQASKRAEAPLITPPSMAPPAEELGYGVDPRASALPTPSMAPLVPPPSFQQSTADFLPEAIPRREPPVPSYVKDYFNVLENQAKETAEELGYGVDPRFQPTDAAGTEDTFLNRFTFSSNDPFKDFPDPLAAAFESAAMGWLGPKAHQPRYMDAVKRGQTHAFGSFWLQKLLLPEGRRGGSYYDYLTKGRHINPKYTQPFYDSIVRASAVAHESPSITDWAESGNEGHLTLEQRKLIGQLVRDHPEFEVDIVAAQEGITGKGYFGAQRLRALYRMKEHYDKRLLRDPNAPPIGFAAWYDGVKKRTSTPITPPQKQPDAFQAIPEPLPFGAEATFT